MSKRQSLIGFDVKSHDVTTNDHQIACSYLLDSNCIRYRFRSSGRVAPWNFKAAEGNNVVNVKGHLITNSLPASLDLALRDMGLVYSFRDYCRTALQEGTLVSVLDDHLPKTPGIFIYFPRENRAMIPLRLLLDLLKQELKA